MQVTVLVIIYRDREHITLHETDALAWSELIKFVDDTWPAHFEGVGQDRPGSDEDRVTLFFATEGDSYVMGNADVSEVEAHVDAAISE